MFKTVSKTPLAFLFALSLLTACGTPPFASESPSSSGPVQITLLDDEDKPVSNQSISFRLGAYRHSTAGSLSEQRVVTDAQGQFRANCALSCQFELEVAGFDSFKGTYSDPPRIRLARRAPEQLQGKSQSAQKVLEAWVETAAAFKALGTLTGTDDTAFEVKTEAGLKALRETLAGIEGISYASGAAQTNLASLQAGQRLLVFSSNHSRLPDSSEPDLLWQTDTSYYFTDREPQLLTAPVPFEAQRQAHSLFNQESRNKIWLTVVSLPDDGRKLIFHAREGRFELAPSTASNASK